MQLNSTFVKLCSKAWEDENSRPTDVDLLSEKTYYMSW